MPTKPKLKKKVAIKTKPAVKSKVKSVKIKVKAPTRKKPAVKKIAVLADGIEIVEKADGTLAISGKNAKMFDGLQVEKQEREYKFDDRLVPYHLGGDSKESNLILREALIKLGKTKEITEMFGALKVAGVAYDKDAQDTFLRALFAVMRGMDTLGLKHIYEDDIEAIHINNLKLFNTRWEVKERMASGIEDLLEGFSDQ